jgi:hypothetical protein
MNTRPGNSPQESLHKRTIREWVWVPNFKSEVIPILDHSGPFQTPLKFRPFLYHDERYQLWMRFISVCKGLPSYNLFW